MRNFVALVFCFIGTTCAAQQWEDKRQFNPEGSLELRILSSTDTAVFEPIIDSFIAANPEISIAYFVTGTADIDTIFRSDPAGYDIVISSAMDLQIKITNDSLALQLDGLTHPSWAQWRKSLFGFTSEPAAIVINKAAFAGEPIPQNRQELIAALRARPEVFHQRVGTYDVRRSGLGYLFATQDARASETYWRLMEVMGAMEVQLYCCSGAMIDDLIDGTIAVAYNVLGSYAAARVENDDAFEIVLPSDFPTTMMRTAFVSAATKHPTSAEAFMRHLISPNDEVGATSLLPGLNGQNGASEPATIALEPALLTFLDGLKRRRFLAEWENAVIQK